MNFDMGTFEVEVQHWSNALDSLDHACRDSGEQKFRRIESIRSTTRIRVERNLCVLGRGEGAVGIHPTGFDLVLEHDATSRLERVMDDAREHRNTTVFHEN
jgi:hypothetical protein